MVDLMDSCHRIRQESAHAERRPWLDVRVGPTVGVFPNEDAIVRPIGAILLEQNDEWAVQRARYMTLETMVPMSDDPTVSLQAIAS
jgi:hypothetical protein